MSSTTAPSATELVVMRRREQLDVVDDRRLRRNLASGSWTRITAGSYVVTAEWRRLRPIQRHRVLVDEVARRLEPGAVISHFAAAAQHDIDILGAWPRRVDVRIERATGGRSGGAVKRRAIGLEGVEREPFGMHELTTPAQTALDIARSAPFLVAASAVDQAIWRDRDGGPLTTVEELTSLLDAVPRQRGDVRARRVLDVADPGAANPRETKAAHVLRSLGFPRSRSQERRILRSGRLVFGDRYFPEHDHWLEVDGRGKYLSPDFGDDRDPHEIVIDEKNRENEIRREVRGFSRLEATDFDNPRLVYDVLTADGLPSTKPRP
ncbi:hypothetical protein [Microbacterium kyungheense]|uniref:Uncharacterized protein n=1 Tax=Microbacterium kyungheense TaxID=1263636 RepID=A0A543FLK7_9MICO|nr:hypothetical protein [Microbacterium kyungheense]TQM34586.1 hypothetical protein FB391_0874 [Microbacterium kyungheense]